MMLMEINLPNYKSKLSSRIVSEGSLKIGGASSYSFMNEMNNITNPVLALEIPYFIDKNYPPVIKNYWNLSSNNFKELFDKALLTPCDILCISFNFNENELENILPEIISTLPVFIKDCAKPVMIKGTRNKNIDNILLTKLAEAIEKPSLFAYADENTYEQIIPGIIKNNHVLALHSPIDINLAKELNILSIDAGLNPDKILIDPDMGALGYGFDYSYSIIEKIKTAAFEGDDMLNMPVITFVGDETFKVKEAKTNKFTKDWGLFEERAVMWEISSASAIIAAGADIIVLSHPKSVETLKDTLWN